MNRGSTPRIVTAAPGAGTSCCVIASFSWFEKIGGPLPPRAAWLRVLLLELERLYNHVGDVGMIVNDTGFAFGLGVANVFHAGDGNIHPIILYDERDASQVERALVSTIEGNQSH